MWVKKCEYVFEVTDYEFSVRFCKIKAAMFHGSHGI